MSNSSAHDLNFGEFLCYHPIGIQFRILMTFRSLHWNIVFRFIFISIKLLLDGCSIKTINPFHNATSVLLRNCVACFDSIVKMRFRTISVPVLIYNVRNFFAIHIFTWISPVFRFLFESVPHTLSLGYFGYVFSRLNLVYYET